MPIPTQLSLNGFVVTAPDLRFTASGKEHVKVRVGVEQWRHEADGSFTKLEPTYHDLVAFESAAREIYARFQRGDSFVASGYVHEYEVEGEGGSVIKEEFVARKIGHSATRTNYVVQRRPQNQPQVASEPVAQAPAVGL